MNTATTNRNVRRRTPRPQSDAPAMERRDGPTPVMFNDQEIAERAYARYVARGGEHGHDIDDWLEAERALREERLTGTADGSLAS